MPGGPLPKTVPELAQQPGSGSSASIDPIATAATQSRPSYPESAQTSPSNQQAGQEGSDIAIDMDEPAAPVPVGPTIQSNSKPSQPAATVMFESPVVPVESSLAKMERLAPETDVAAADAGDDDSESNEDSDTSPRPTPSKARYKAKPLAKKGSKPKPGKAAKWSTSEREDEEPGAEDAGEAKPTSSKTPLIVVAAVVVAALIGGGVYMLRGKGKAESEPTAVTTAKSPEPTPAQAEPTPAEEPAALAAKPVPTVAAKPEPKAKPAEKPPAPDKPAHVEKPAPAEKPARAEKPAVAEKPAATEKPKAEAAAPESKAANGKPSEADYKRANEAYERGNAKLFQGNSAEAINEFNQALKLNPKDPAIHRGLGLAYAQAGKSADATKHLKLYLKNAPKATDRAIIEKRLDQLRGH